MKKNNIIEFFKENGLLLVIFLGPLIIFIIMTIFKGNSTKVLVHWHMPISYNLCGDTTQLKDSGEHGIVHGHDGGKIHIEGYIDKNNRKETLGNFFDNANIPFDFDRIGKYKNGDICSGSTIPGKVSVIINGSKNTDFRNYILNDKDTIKIFFN